MAELLALLHPLRRRAALARLVRRGPVSSALVVCNGNICRSPFAAAVLRRTLPPGVRDRIRVDSAGFIGPGRPAPAEALAAAAQRGVDLSGHRSRVLTPELVRSADLIVVMDASQRREIGFRFGRRRDVVLLGELDPSRLAPRAVRDPVEQPLEVFEDCYARIERCARALAAALARGALVPTR